MKGRFYEALTDDPMVDVITEQGSMREVLPTGGTSESVLVRARIVHEFADDNTLIVGQAVVPAGFVSASMAVSEVDVHRPYIPTPPTGKFPMHEGGR